MKKQQPKPKGVTVGRLKQVSDSLKKQEAKKIASSIGAIKSNKPSADNSKMVSKALNSADSDKARYSRYDSLIKKATAPKPMMKMTKTLTPMKKK
jgi:hypothetical protein